AEDGIRDFHVTGVQTCALPISYADLPAALADCAPARTRVLRGLDHRVDAAVAPYDPDGGGTRDRELAWTISELKLVKDPWEIAQDRKSTRLNSSHVKISYAVFW